MLQYNQSVYSSQGETNKKAKFNMNNTQYNQ